MKTKISMCSSVFLAAFLCAGYSHAGEQKKMVIELKTDDFEMTETDISDLEIGESETIVTESGKTIDLLRTTEGVEVYVDGVLMDMPGLHEADGVHGKHHRIHKNITIECEVTGEADSDSACGEDMFFFSDEDVDFEAIHAVGEAHRIIMKRVHEECISDVEDECEDHQLWFSDSDSAEFAELHEAGEGHKVIRIHHSDDVGGDFEVEKIIIIEKD